MLFRVVAFAGWALVAGVSGLGWTSAAQAQSLSDIKGPRELPPAGFKGAQYVDSRGCVFLRAGVAGQVNWVARVSANRRALCGYPPTASAMAPQAAPKTQEVVAAQAPVGRPIDTIASLKTPPTIRDSARRSAVPTASYVAPPVVVAPAPKASPVAVAPARPVGVSVAAVPLAPVPLTAVPRNGACPADAPYGQRYPLTDGRIMLICAIDPSRLPKVAQAGTARRSTSAPAVVAGVMQAGVVTGGVVQAGRMVCPASAPVARRYLLQGGGTTTLCTAQTGGFASSIPPLPDRVAEVPVVPKGYKPAWKDGRLNPLRGVGTAAGQIAQDQVWTRSVPAKPVAQVQARQTGTVVLSTKTAPQEMVAPVLVAPGRAADKSRAGFFVQVGTFGQAANAQNAGARLSRLGLPVAASR
ncbi:MAG: hypothetical protein U1D06_01745, partial [Paracoccaceae bacterium]|nr:hypothetical protein [Paracoccaceae bacterium]